VFGCFLSLMIPELVFGDATKLQARTLAVPFTSLPPRTPQPPQPPRKRKGKCAVEFRGRLPAGSVSRQFNHPESLLPT
jgi:hypothetical protein